MNTLLFLSFDGRRYHGWQVQQNAVGICTVLQDAMQRLFGQRPDVKGCSRTDAGVHARQYAVSFRHQHNIPIQRLPMALNRFLPQDIRVTKAQKVPWEFHARYSALAKEYQYLLLNSHIDDPFMRGLYHRVNGLLDHTLMQQAANHLVGRHDFSAFMSSGSTIEDRVRTVSRLKVERKDDWVSISITADGYLYNMVRIIAGTLLRVGRGKQSPDEIANVLSSRNRGQAGETLPPGGLFLNRVWYDEQSLSLETAGSFDNQTTIL